MSGKQTGRAVLRLSALQQIILGLLSKQPKPGLCGKELLDLGGKELKKGSIYVTLQRMQAKGLVDSMREDAGSMPSDSAVVRRFYTPTNLGLSLLPQETSKASDQAPAGEVNR